MSKRIVKIRSGEKVPSGAVHLKSIQEHDHANSYRRWERTPGIMGRIPIFGTETLYRITPVVTFHYYEVDDSKSDFLQGERYE